MRYAAFLRGINLGPRNRFEMDELTRIFTGLGFGGVRTVLASGNVVFESDEQDQARLINMIESHLLQLRGSELKVLVRTIPELQAMVAANPFAAYTDNEQVKLYVTFLPAVQEALRSLPPRSEKDGWEIVALSNLELYIVTYGLPNGRFGNLTRVDKAAGPGTTTRNWNTVVKVASLS